MIQIFFLQNNQIQLYCVAKKKICAMIRKNGLKCPASQLHIYAALLHMKVSVKNEESTHHRHHHYQHIHHLIHIKVRVKNVERGVDRGNWRSWVTIMYLHTA